MTLAGLKEAGKLVETASMEAVRLLGELPGENGYLAWLIEKLIHREK